MKSKRIIVSLREDELTLLRKVLEDSISSLPEFPEETNVVYRQAIVILRENLTKLYNKLEDKNGK